MAVPPKPPSKRRRRNVPKSWGAAMPFQAGQAAPQPPLGFPTHAMVLDLWQSLHSSTESRFYTAADWQRARLELLLLNKMLEGDVPMTAALWRQVQRGLGDLLISPADKRRIGIELAAYAEDPDENAAVSMMGKYAGKLQVVKPE